MMMWRCGVEGPVGMARERSLRWMWRVEIRFAALRRKERIRRGAKRALDALMRRWQHSDNNAKGGT